MTTSSSTPLSGSRLAANHDGPSAAEPAESAAADPGTSDGPAAGVGAAPVGDGGAAELPGPAGVLADGAAVAGSRRVNRAARSPGGRRR